MVVVYHKNNRIVKVVSGQNSFLPFDDRALISEALYQLAVRYPKTKIVWCKEELQGYLNLKVIETVFHHNKMMLSYNPGQIDFLGRKIGYVEESPFIKINKKISHPTWQMSSTVGVVHASLFLEIKNKIKMDADFDYYLNSVAKVCMPLGLLCYSEPKLLNAFEGSIVYTQTSIYTLFKFVKQHYKMRWQILLFLNLMVFEKQFPLLPFIFSIFYKNRKNNKLHLDTIPVQSTLKTTSDRTIDVIIPTIGRKKYLYDVLQDLASQTHLPINVILVEQNTLPNSASELDYLTTGKWPFAIKHNFTHQAGACNARNLALSQVKSEWVFLADDDIRIENNFIEKVLDQITTFGVKAVSVKCYQKENRLEEKIIFQWPNFGSGCSFVHNDLLFNMKFNMSFEFGFCEDTDFGMQLRNQGADVLYLPEPSILHLKAPIGGFRTKPQLQWQSDIVQPKPSPTIMLYQILHNTKEQRLGYKTILFFKYYKRQKIKNPIRYYLNFQKQWVRSVFWANQLKQQNEV